MITEIKTKGDSKMMTLELLKQLAKALAVQFGNDCEVVIHDLTRKSLHKSIVYIENGHITNRKTGDGPSKVVLETMRKDPSKISDHLGYLTKTNDGKTLKSSKIIRSFPSVVKYPEYPGLFADNPDTGSCSVDLVEEKNPDSILPFESFSVHRFSRGSRSIPAPHISYNIISVLL